MLENCARKAKTYPNYKYYGMSKEEIKALWDKISGDACDFGTRCHAFGESMFYWMTGQNDKILPECKEKFDENGPKPTNKHEEAIVKFWDDLPENFVPVLAETKVVNKKGKPYCGTFDILFYYVDEPESPKNGLLIFDYKGLDINTPILTDCGWKQMGQIEIGDVVFDKNGEKTNVIGVSEIKKKPRYKITFDNNDEIIADGEHRWEIYFWYTKEHPKTVIMTTEEILLFMNNNDRKKIINIPRVMNNKPIVSTSHTLPLDPYVLGVWLGDGSSSCSYITNMYEEIFEEIKRRGYQVGEDVSNGGSGKAKTRCVKNIRSVLKELNLLNNKHIPESYLLSSYENRLLLLKGIMDTDGYYNTKRKRFVLTTTHYEQVVFCKQLLSSLGIKSTIVKCKKYCNEKQIDGFDLTFTTELYPFLVRKIKTNVVKTNKRDFKNIKKIEKIEEGLTKCIEVDSPTHTFLCDYSLTVTHNTNKDLYNSYNRDKENFMLSPFDDLYEESLSHYYLQLACYQNPIEQLGYKVIGRRLIWLRQDGEYQKIKVPDMVERMRAALDSLK